MALIESSMMPLGTSAPDFKLPEPRSGQTLSLEQLRGEKGTLVMFICNHCPYVLHLEEALLELGEHYRETGIGMVAISANDALSYPQDGPDRMAEKHWPFPYLYDESQQVARSYGAECTPDFFLFDAGLRCVYRGQFDDSRPGNDQPVTGRDLKQAIEALLAGLPAEPDQKPSIGCNIKWRA